MMPFFSKGIVQLCNLAMCEEVSDMDDLWHILGDWSIWGRVTYYMSIFVLFKAVQAVVDLSSSKSCHTWGDDDYSTQSLGHGVRVVKKFFCRLIWQLFFPLLFIWTFLLSILSNEVLCFYFIGIYLVDSLFCHIACWLLY